MTTKTTDATIDPTAALADAREALRRVRIGVANGTHNAAQLADAEQAVHFAEVRIAAADEARQEKARQREAERLAAIRDQLEALKPLQAKQAEREDVLRDVLADYLSTASDIANTIYGVHWELDDIKRRSRSLPDGFRIGPLPTSVVCNGETYFAKDGVAHLRTLMTEAEAAGRVARKGAKK